MRGACRAGRRDDVAARKWGSGQHQVTTREATDEPSSETTTTLQRRRRSPSAEGRPASAPRLGAPMSQSARRVAGGGPPGRLLTCEIWPQDLMSIPGVTMTSNPIQTRVVAFQPFGEKIATVTSRRWPRGTSPDSMCVESLSPLGAIARSRMNQGASEVSPARAAGPPFDAPPGRAGCPAPLVTATRAVRDRGAILEPTQSAFVHGAFSACRRDDVATACSGAAPR